MNIKIIFNKFSKIFLNFIILLFSISCVFPFIWIIYSSLKTQKEFSLNIVSLPANPQLSNYIEAITRGEVHVAFLNSSLISLIAISFILLIGFITGYMLSRFDFPGRNFLYIFFLAGMLIPIHGLLVPIFIQFNELNLYDSRLGLLLPYVAFGLPMTIFLVESFIKSIPIEIEEAAVIDGSNIFQRMFRIVLPVCKPVLSTSLILSFLSTWNEFPFALILLRSDELKTMPLWLTQFSGQFSTNYPQMMAALVIASIPVIIIYLLFYKRVIDGMTAGAVKG